MPGPKKSGSMSVMISLLPFRFTCVPVIMRLLLLIVPSGSGETQLLPFTVAENEPLSIIFSTEIVPRSVWLLALISARRLAGYLKLGLVRNETVYWPGGRLPIVNVLSPSGMAS